MLRPSTAFDSASFLRAWANDLRDSSTPVVDEFNSVVLDCAGDEFVASALADCDIGSVVGGGVSAPMGTSDLMK